MTINDQPIRGMDVVSDSEELEERMNALSAAAAERAKAGLMPTRVDPKTEPLLRKPGW